MIIELTEFQPPYRLESNAHVPGPTGRAPVDGDLESGTRHVVDTSQRVPLN
jgi:hypothetical protein